MQKWIGQRVNSRKSSLQRALRQVSAKLGAAPSCLSAEVATGGAKPACAAFVFRDMAAWLVGKSKQALYLTTPAGFLLQAKPFHWRTDQMWSTSSWGRWESGRQLVKSASAGRRGCC